MKQFPAQATKNYLDPTWSLFDREPGMDDLADQVQVQEMIQVIDETLGISPYQDTDRNDRLFLARFEFPKHGESFTFSEAANDGVAGFIHFLAGFPIDCVEMLLAIGEISTVADKVDVEPGTGVTPPVPAHFFQWPDEDKVLFNLTAIATPDVGEILARNLDGEASPQKLHWWFGCQLTAGSAKKFPVPGEFLSLGVRMMPGMYWGHQKSSPFLYSGNFMDTVYYSGARITEVIAATEETPYPTYRVKWRDAEVVVTPSDFAEYQVDDRVTILKDVETTKTTQLWKDEDMNTFGGKWVIAPITFYGLEVE